MSAHEHEQGDQEDRWSRLTRRAEQAEARLAALKNELQETRVLLATQADEHNEELAILGNTIGDLQKRIASREKQLRGIGQELLRVIPVNGQHSRPLVDTLPAGPRQKLRELLSTPEAGPPAMVIENWPRPFTQADSPGKGDE